MARLCRASIWIRCRQEDPDAIAGRRRAEGQNELKVLHRCPEDGGRAPKTEGGTATGQGPSAPLEAGENGRRSSP